MPESRESTEKTTASSSARPAGAVSSDIAQGQASGRPADSSGNETLDMNTAREQATIEENQKRLDEATNKGEKTTANSGSSRA